MSRGLQGLPCVFCGEPSGDDGEHSPPRWFIRERFPDGGMYSKQIGGNPALNSKGKPLSARPNFPRTHVPCCGKHNGILNKRFEDSLSHRSIVTLLFDGVDDFTAEEVTFLRDWLGKTLLLMHHHDAVEEAHSSKPADRRVDLASIHLDWAVEGEPLPSEFSLWVARDSEESEKRVTVSPDVKFWWKRLEAEDGQVESFYISLVLDGLFLLLVFHPGWLPTFCFGSDPGTKLLRDPVVSVPTVTQSDRSVIEGMFTLYKVFDFGAFQDIERLRQDPIPLTGRESELSLLLALSGRGCLGGSSVTA